MTESSEKIKSIVKDKYAKIAEQSRAQNASSCCGSSCGCSSIDEVVFADDYSRLEGYNPDADLGLGCGLPTEIAAIRNGDVVVDLGSGAGNDVFVARRLTGEKGKVIGIDMTEAMIEKARKNNEKLGYGNVEFRLGDIEHLPVDSNSTDVVISNCVLNLVPNKEKAFAEIYRVLKPGAHFAISDVVVTGELPQGIRSAAEMYAGCVAGAIVKEDYLEVIRKSGFQNVTVKKGKKVTVPDDVLTEYLSEKELAEFKQFGAGILSVTVYGEKPMHDENRTQKKEIESDRR